VATPASAALLPGMPAKELWSMKNSGSVSDTKGARYIAKQNWLN